MLIRIKSVNNNLIIINHNYKLKMKYSILALTFASVSQAHKLNAYGQHKHAVDFLDDNGESVTFESMLAN